MYFHPKGISMKKRSIPGAMGNNLLDKVLHVIKGNS